jgi:hypothetical protein
MNGILSLTSYAPLLTKLTILPRLTVPVKSNTNTEKRTTNIKKSKLNKVLHPASSLVSLAISFYLFYYIAILFLILLKVKKRILARFI